MKSRFPSLKLRHTARSPDGVRSTMFAAALLMTTTLVSAEEPLPGSDQLAFFESRVRPLLIEHCYECHSVDAGESSGELLIDSAAGIFKGGTHGKALVPGDPGGSLIFRAVSYEDADLQMPPEGKLSAEAIETLRLWIQMGAPDPRDATLEESASPLSRDPASHWAFNAPARSRPPHDPSGKSRDAIDSHAAAGAAAAGIVPNQQASRETLVRRLYYDLTGLPPSQHVIASFIESGRPTDYAKLVDSLLSTPEYGERFGRHWLDVARYADTVGYALAGRERRYEGSDRYRDWVIQSFANDIAYDEMLRHQLAADRTDPENEQGNLDAMGFLTLGRKFLNPLDVIDDRIDVITRGLLGMTVTCARCHDHKFDPIPSSDYYALGGIIFSSKQPDDGPSPLMMVDKKTPIDSPVLIRGQLGNHGPIAPRQFLTALRKPEEPRFTDGSGRWELAQRIATADNPLTARVMVNRVWAKLIGKPLVNTPSDFGFRTPPPAVPEVLDDLAHDFSQHWSIKRLVRRIVMSRIYRQTSNASPEAITIDADNGLLARANRKRRDFESLRDAMLQTSGLMNTKMGGDPIEITLANVTPRRTVYAMIDRQNLPSLFRTFDFASPDAHAPKRFLTTVPQQALFLLNNAQIHELARSAARRVRADHPAEDNSALASAMFRRLLARSPDDSELEAVNQFLSSPNRDLDPVIDVASLWTYGTSKIDERFRPQDFTPLTVFKDGTWRATDSFPAPPPFGHASLSKENGHPPNDVQLAVVRRFTAPFSGTVKLRGQMGHRNEKGDGFQASIWVAGKRLFSSMQKQNNRPYGPLQWPIEQGQTVDLVASAGEHDSFDSFFWRVGIRLVDGKGRVLETESTRHFSGPRDPDSMRPMDRLEQLAQTLLMSNEFSFID